MRSMTDQARSPLHRSSFGILSATAAAALAFTACAPEEELPTDDDQAQTENQTEEQTEEQTEASPSPDAEENDDAADDETPDDDAADGVEETDDDDADAGTEGEEHVVYQAIQAALEEYPDGVITKFEDESDDDGYVELSVYDGTTEWELEVDAESFEITKTEDDGIDGDDEQKAQAVEIDIAEALQTAEQESGGQPHEGELDTEDGVVVWELEMDNDVEVYVDVATGDVVKVDN